VFSLSLRFKPTSGIENAPSPSFNGGLLNGGRDVSKDFDRIYIRESSKTKEKMIDRTYRIENRNSLFDPQLRQKILLFHHVGRTGGACINDILVRMQEATGIPLIIPNQEQAISDNPPWAGRQAPLVISAHHTFGLHERIDGDSGYFGLMRDPYKHFLAKVLLWDEYKTESNHMAGVWERFERKIDGIREKAGHCNSQTYEHATYFEDKPLPYTSPENLEGTNPGDLFSKAVENIEDRFFFVGITELLEESLFVLFDMIGIKKTLMWRPGLYTHWRPSKDELPIRIYKKISALLEADLDLYHRNRQCLEDMLARSDFGEELVRYKQHARNPYSRLYLELSERFTVAASTFGPFSEMVEKEFAHSQALIHNIGELSRNFFKTRKENKILHRIIAWLEKYDIGKELWRDAIRKKGVSCAPAILLKRFLLRLRNEWAAQQSSKTLLIRRVKSFIHEIKRLFRRILG